MWNYSYGFGAWSAAATVNYLSGSHVYADKRTDTGITENWNGGAYDTVSEKPAAMPAL